MEYRNMSSQVTVQNPRAAAVFTQSYLRRILLQFAAQPRSIAEVANELQIDIKQLHQIVSKFHRLGLLIITEQRQRAGRAIRFYQASAERFFIPAAATPALFSRGLAKELREALSRDAAIAVKGMLFSLDDDGRVLGQVVENPGAAFVPLDSWRILRLSASRAAELKQEIFSLLDRYQNEIESSGQVFLIHAGMARRLEHRGATDNRKRPVSTD
jgi:hypothetical protein